MFKKKCPDCDKKIERKFNFCPYCGFNFRSKTSNKQEDFGLIGKDDAVPQEMKMFGIDKIMNGLIKQLGKELGGGNPAAGPKFSIQISTNKPEVVQRMPNEKFEITKQDVENRRGLPKKEAESQVRRFGDKIVYEIAVPGVKNKKDVVITNLENGIEIKAYSKDFCYIKNLPLKMDVSRYALKEDILFLEFNG